MRVFVTLLTVILMQFAASCFAKDLSTELFEAIQKSDQKVVDAVLAGPTKTTLETLSARNPSGATPLLFAAYLERETMVQQLRAAKPKLDFFEACVVGDLSALRGALARGQNVNERAPDGFTALGLAVFFRQPQAAMLLVDAGAELDAKASNALQVAPIHAAVARSDLATLGLLLERGADPNLTQQKLVRPIHDAAASGNLAATAMLLMFNADATVKTEEGSTPVDLARAKGHAELALQLERYIDQHELAKANSSLRN
jgi:uncharacterized protein